MTKEVLLSLKGLQMEIGEETQALETITPADYYERNGKHYVIYEEMMEGFTDVTKNRIKFSDSSLEVYKKGLINVHMVFEENKKNMTSYMTPYGTILIGIDTESVLVEEKENQIRVEVDYALEANYQHLADCRIEMELRPREEGINLGYGSQTLS
ncbi:DUF1934 domain-containing protein [Parablautia muri]|uniref:DUF1934 domain-containing protein n=1 Tax=Parablautia muri TaxID=2320879 RepID=A0A9X5BHL5_9FIRM|nr:DUF1934 domain-containing protein [Parablautia muri]NBJ94246.1 DUF1934 domain-containing protein [Parablautia muri]